MFILPQLLPHAKVQRSGDTSYYKEAFDMSVQTGVFCISPVCGLDYETPSQRGLTNERGEFLYRER